MPQGPSINMSKKQMNLTQNGQEEVSLDLRHLLYLLPLSEARTISCSKLNLESLLSFDIYLGSQSDSNLKNSQIQIWLIDETREFSHSSGALASSKQELKHSFTCGQHRKGEPFTVNASLMQSNHLFQRQNSSKKP